VVPHLHHFSITFYNIFVFHTFNLDLDLNSSYPNLCSQPIGSCNLGFFLVSNPRVNLPLRCERCCVMRLTELYHMKNQANLSREVFTYCKGKLTTLGSETKDTPKLSNYIG
jgi:hypothetical protein